MEQVGMLQSVQVGRPTRYGGDGMGGAWETSFVREPEVEAGWRWLFATHLEGNAQADTKNHGGPEAAVLLYAAAHYPVWRAELGQAEMGPGGFGENFTVEGLEEGTVCVGDVHAVGEARIVVTEPRYPCEKISRRWGIPGLRGRVAATGRTGWYCRVAREGWVEAGLSIALVERPFPEVTIALVNDFGHGRKRDEAAARAVAACPALTEWWRRLVVLRAVGSEAWP